MDSMLVASEVLHSLKTSRKGGVLFKVDFEKAYNLVRWDFLLFVLSKMSFGVKWRGWIEECISIVKLSILINHSPMKEFRMRRGLRQGDPLSPFLFNIVAEGLSLLIHKAEERNLISGFPISRASFSVSHLQYTNDTLLFCKADLSQILVFKRILRCFEMISGLSINLAKSVIAGCNISEERSRAWASMVKCK